MPRGDQGFSYAVLLVWLATASLSLAAIGPMWSDQVRRERELELLRVGELYAQAIARYREVSPGSEKRYPERLDALVLDPRFVGTMRHLRRLYADPVNPGQPWGLVLDDAGRIMGVFSQSELEPVAQRPVAPSGRSMPLARRYADWKFIAAISEKGS